MLYIFKILLLKVPLQLRKRSRVQEFRRLFYENCQWRGVPRYVEMFFKYIVTPSPAKFCSWFLKKWNHLNWRVFSPAALYKGFLPCWLRMAPWSLTFWLSFEQVQQTPVAIFCLLLCLQYFVYYSSSLHSFVFYQIRRYSGATAWWGGKKNQTKIKLSDSKIDFFSTFQKYSHQFRESERHSILNKTVRKC